MRGGALLGKSVSVLAIIAMSFGCSSNSSAPSAPGTPTFSVDSIAPVSGLATGGTTVTLTGTGFVSGTTVSFGGAAATGVTITATRITAVAPAHADGTIDVVITLSATENVTLVGGYTYVTVPAPTSVAPASGATSGGTNVTIAGTGFSGDATVTFGGTTATNIRVVSTTTITATTPARTSGVVDVVVTNGNGRSGTLRSAYTYVAPAPTISSISPNSGATTGGTVVTITGTGFINTTSVTFGGSSATSGTFNNSVGTSITVTTPARPAGVVSVVVTNADGQSVTATNAYTYR